MSVCPRRSLDEVIFDACQPALGTIAQATLTYADRAYTNSMDLHSMAEADGDVRPPAAASAAEPYVNTRQHTSAYVSIPQHTSAYVRLRATYVTLAPCSSPLRDKAEVAVG